MDKEFSETDPKKKYFKRADLAQKQAEEYWKKHSNLVKPDNVSQIIQAALEKVNQDYLNEIIKSTPEDDQNESNDVSVKDDGTTLEDVDRMRKELGQGDKDKDHEIVLGFFKFVLKNGVNS
ncbi:Pre-mRNA-splicing factor 18 [Bulinus truncatus]|nr:Pre-mRNA-splicing factor 18 [Bulinus truncatus]